MSEYGPFPADLEVLIRQHLSKDCNLTDAENPEAVQLRGRQVKFYRNTWLGYVETIAHGAAGNRRYFLTRPKSRKDRILPIANEAGSVDRANVRFKLVLTRDNIIDYLNFYFSFTPKEDPMLSHLPGGATQFAVSRSVNDFKFEHAAGVLRSQASSDPSCSEECLVQGAVWHFLDRRTHKIVVPFRYKKRRVSPFKVSGRIPIQFRHAVFATDFKLAETSGVPVLSNIELLYQSDALKEPEVLPNDCLPIPKRVARREFLDELIFNAKQRLAQLSTRLGRMAWSIFVLLLLCFWAIAALFSVGEWADWDWVRQTFKFWSDALGQNDWATFAWWWTAAAIVTFLWGIVMTTHRDKVFNWMFRFCPEPLQGWVARVLDRYVTRWDAALISQNTFSKRVWWSTIHLVPWTIYLVLAFASLQVLGDLTEGQEPRPALLIAQTLLVQAGLNLPFVTYLLIHGLELGSGLTR